MQGRRLLIVFVFLIIIVALVAFLAIEGGLIGGDSGNNDPNSGAGTPVADVATNTPEPTITPLPVVEIVVAVQDIPRGIEIQPNAIDIRQWPEDMVPNQAVFSTTELVGKIARADIFREQPILRNMVVDNLAGIGNAGSDAAAILPSNRVGVTLPIDVITSVGYAIQPGDRVDMIVSLLFVDVDEDFQTIEPNFISLINERPELDEEGEPTGVILREFVEPLVGRPDVIPSLGDALIVPSEDQRPRLVTQRTIQDALVIYLGEFPLSGKIFVATPTPVPQPTVDPEAEVAVQEDGQPVATLAPTAVPRPEIITVGVSPQDAVVITWFVESKLPLTFALRSARATSQVPTDPVSLEYIMQTFRVELPGKRPFALQPPITSIRELIAGDQISLSSNRAADQ